MIETAGIDTLRRDHVLGTGLFRGVLFEPEATNLLHYSNSFTHQDWYGHWSKPSFSVGLTAPDGSSTAMGWNCTETTGGLDGLRGGLVMKDESVAGTSTVSIWLRASAPVALRFGQSDGNSEIINVTTDWQRFTYTEVLPNAQDRIFVLSETEGADIDIEIWGAQVEIGSKETTIIPTDGSAASRSADVAGLSGTNGTFDVTLTYDDDSQDTLLAQSIGEGWWPVLRRNHLKHILIE
ncbi:phage head spike fiber domain-containing protein [Ruegeria lacuscaerulensis]|uniref:phage head spike fiber domain-containing protein n=1 Tax=Ruegeria lacuscaerulensis TaxID=55218 RepID=UPI00147F7C60|nr:hypothetical protein [Ruegeria lacuscaerulensis]